METQTQNPSLLPPPSPFKYPQQQNQQQVYRAQPPYHQSHPQHHLSLSTTACTPIYMGPQDSRDSETVDRVNHCDMASNLSVMKTKLAIFFVYNTITVASFLTYFAVTIVKTALDYGECTSNYQPWCDYYGNARQMVVMITSYSFMSCVGVIFIVYSINTCHKTSKTLAQQENSLLNLYLKNKCREINLYAAPESIKLDCAK
jgi:hypothetical protein